jgi:hypothetical protein
MVITYLNRQEQRQPTTTEVDYELVLRDGTREVVTGADAYQQEQSMTTFFRTDGRRGVDCWSVRMASFRTDEILTIRRRSGEPHR